MPLESSTPAWPNTRRRSQPALPGVEGEYVHRVGHQQQQAVRRVFQTCSTIVSITAIDIQHHRVTYPVCAVTRL
jgi:hypothetical protein